MIGQYFGQLWSWAGTVSLQYCSHASRHWWLVHESTRVNVWLFQIVDQWSHGAPDTACAHLTPGHGHRSLIDSSVDLDTESLRGESPYIRVSIKSSVSFRGFIIRAVDEDGNVTGSWSIPYLQYQYYPLSEGSVQYLDCDHIPRTAVTHSRAFQADNLVSLQWIPGEKFQGKVVFEATLVANYSTYWRLSSKALHIALESFKEVARSTEQLEETSVVVNTSVIVLQSQYSDSYNYQPWLASVNKSGSASQDSITFNYFVSLLILKHNSWIFHFIS